MTAPVQSPDISYNDLLTQHGYAGAAVLLISQKPVVTEESVEKRFTQFIDNYYMQFLAVQLDRYHFDLNRPMIPRDELNHADNIIEGKLGNPPLDTAHLIALLTETTNKLVEQNKTTPLTWNGFYSYTYTAHDGSQIRGQDIIRAMLKSDSTHKGAYVENYRHHYRGREFTTHTMMQTIAEELSELQPQGLHGINRFGRQVQQQHIDSTCKLALRVSRMRQPKLSDYYNVNSHEKIKQTMTDIFQNLLGARDLRLLHEQRLQLARDYFNPGMYNHDWQLFLTELDAMLQLIATPFA